MTRPAPSVDPASGRRADGTGPDHLALLARCQEAFAADAAGADPDATVPACGRWRVRDLVTHVGEVHHWAASRARRRPEEPLGDGPTDLAPFYVAQAAELFDTLRLLGPDAPSWTLLGDGPASFWRRRQLHEVLVHLHDLRAARLGSGVAVEREAPLDAPAAVWADTVDEVVHLFTPRQVRLGRMGPLPVTVALEATDVSWSWTLGDGASPEAVVRAGAHDLALLLWRRLAPSEVEIEVVGERAALDVLLAAPIVP